MSDQKTIKIGGRIYDARTGLAIDDSRPVVKNPHAQSVHKTQQKSTSLSRKYTKKPEPGRNVMKHHDVMRPASRKPSAHGHEQSPHITKHVPHAPSVHHAQRVMDIQPQKHPLVEKTHAKIAAQKSPKPSTPKPSEIIKNEAIQNALEKAPKSSHKQHRRGMGLRSKATGIVSAAFALLILGGYFMYLNMPNLSVRVAAARAGIDASYPEYRPDGYRLNGAVTYQKGEVSLAFAANGGPQGFTITQTKSSFDSSAVRQLVYERTNGQFQSTSEKGITIYSYDSNAAWVNGGILYQIEGDAPLSSDQIRRIATSM